MELPFIPGASSAAWRALKKNAGGNDDRSRLSAHSAEMVAHCEQLRGDALQPANRLVATPGRALFLRQGMAGWMLAWSACMGQPDVQQNPAPAASPPLSQGLRAQLAIILAGMILGQQQGGTT